MKSLVATAVGVLLVPVGLFAQGSLTPPGGPAPSMKTLDQIEPRKLVDRLPATLSEPGAYVVTRNLSFDAGTGLTVTASDVTIDLNGFVLTGDPAGGGHGIAVASGLANVTIRNGVLRGWGGDGVHAPATLDLMLDRVRIEACAGDGCEVGSARLQDVVLSGNGGAGLRTKHDTVKNSINNVRARIENNGGGGVITDGWQMLGLTDVVVSGNTGPGLSVTATLDGQRPSVRAEGCVFDDNTGDGIQCLTLPGVNGAEYALAVWNSSASGNGGRGLVVSGRKALCEWISCRVERNAGDGLLSVGTSDTVLRDCVIVGNTGDGLAWTSETAGDALSLRLDRCRLSANSGSGLRVESADRVAVALGATACRFDSNGVHGVHAGLTGDDTRLALDIGDNDCDGNAEDGIRVHASGARGYTFVSVRNISSASQLSGNGGNGLTVQALGVDSRMNSMVAGLACSDNGGHGVEIEGRGGLVRMEGCDFSENDGLALSTYTPDEMLVVLRHCDMNANGGGGAAFAGPGDITLEASRIRSNTGHGVAWSSVGSSDACRMTLRDSQVGGNTGNGLHAVEGKPVFFECYPTRCVLDGNGGDGVRVHLTHVDSRLRIEHRGGGASDNVGHGISLIAAGREATQGFFDIALRANGKSGFHEVCAPPADGRMENVAATGNGEHGVDLTCNKQFSMARGVASGNALDGIRCVFTRHPYGHVTVLKLADTAADDNGHAGVSVTDAEVATAYRLELLDSRVTGNGGHGLAVSAAGTGTVGTLVWRDCAADGNGSNGVHLAAAAGTGGLALRMMGGSGDRNGGSGVVIDDGSAQPRAVRALTVAGNGGHGIESAAAGLSVTDCLAMWNDGSGIRVTGAAHHLSGNECRENGVGIELISSGHAVRGNTFHGASQTPVVDGAGANAVAPMQAVDTGTNPLGNISF